MDQSDTKIALSSLDRKTPSFFIVEAFWWGDTLVAARAQDVLDSLGSKPEAIQALKAILTSR